jgi:hypothetical protein
MAAREYVNFDLELGPRGEGYVARVRASPVGEASGTFSLPFTPEGLENVVLRLGRSRTTVRRIASRQDEMVEGFGSSLYDAVFGGEVGTSLRRSIDEAARQGKGLRIRLHLEDAPELGEVPWELLFVPGLARHLVLSSSTPLVRYLGLPGTPRALRVEGPIRVLLVVAAPSDVVRLDAAHEVALIEEATADLRQAGVIALDSMAGATLRELQRRLRRAEYHVLHFIGHGGYDERIGEGVLAFEDDDGRSQLVPTSHLGTILADHHTLRLAVLNACEGARSSATDPFAGIAPGLIRRGIPAVIAMQFEVTDTAAAIFGHEFYLALADGCPVDQAAAEARKAMYASDCDVEWATPVLYLRASDGRIFDTPSIDRSGLERPASLGAAPVNTGDLVKQAGRPAPAAEREPAATPAAAHEPPSVAPPPVAPPPATIPVAATPQSPPPSPAGAVKDDLPPAARKRVEPRPKADDEATVSPWALPFPINVDEPSPEPPRDAGRGGTPASGRADGSRTSKTQRSTAAAEPSRGGAGEWTADANAWEGTASGGAWPPEAGKWTTEEEYPPASSSGGGRWLLVLLLVAAVAFVAWWVNTREDGEEPDGRPEAVTEPQREPEPERGSGPDPPEPNPDTDTEPPPVITFVQLVDQCREGELDLEACGRVLEEAERDEAVWRQALVVVLDECRQEQYEPCRELAEEYGSDQLTEKVNEWLGQCLDETLEDACLRVMGFAVPGSDEAWRAEQALVETTEEDQTTDEGP